MRKNFGLLSLSLKSTEATFFKLINGLRVVQTMNSPHSVAYEKDFIIRVIYRSNPLRPKPIIRERKLQLSFENFGPHSSFHGFVNWSHYFPLWSPRKSIVKKNVCFLVQFFNPWVFDLKIKQISHFERKIQFSTVLHFSEKHFWRWNEIFSAFNKK